jgi:myo-inositol-1(or 4)-monophosphatase
MSPSLPDSKDLQTFLLAATEAAKTAGAYSRSRFGTRLDVEMKGEINPVTEVDKESERLIAESLRRRFPDHDILGEEGQGQRKDSPYKWIIDPLDGTVNYSHGYPLYAVSIALEFEGSIIAGAVYDPLHEEMFSAVKGGGAFLNGNPIRVSGVEKLIQAMIGTGFSYTFKQNKDKSLEHFQNIIMRAQAVRRDGVAAIDLCYVACGRFDGFWELNLFPWDVAAGVLIITEAHGKVSRFDGTPFSVYDKEILVTNGIVHAEMISALAMARS